MSTNFDPERDSKLTMPSDGSRKLDADAAARIDANRGLAFRVTEAVMDDPSILDESEEDSLVILTPDDDPALAEANVRGGERMARAGHRVAFYRVSDSGQIRSGR